MACSYSVMADPKSPAAVFSSAALRNIPAVTSCCDAGLGPEGGAGGMLTTSGTAGGPPTPPGGF